MSGRGDGEVLAGLMQTPPLQIIDIIKYAASAHPDVEAVFQQEAFKTSDCVEGIAAFVEKRSPRFTGE